MGKQIYPDTMESTVLGLKITKNKTAVVVMVSITMIRVYFTLNFQSSVSVGSQGRY